MASIISNVYKLAMKIYGAIIGTDVDSLCKYLEKDRAATPSAKLYSECHIAKLLFNNKYSYYVIKKKGVKTHTKAIIYLPGGGFILPLTVTHFSYIERLSKTTNAVIYILLYPLSTKNYSSCFDINQFIVDFYKKLLKKFAASDITIMGDSAGGTLALTGAYQIKLNNLPVPENIISISPCARLNFSD
jgi:acetyl esterase/lipase